MPPKKRKLPPPVGGSKKRSRLTPMANDNDKSVSSNILSGNVNQGNTTCSSRRIRKNTDGGEGTSSSIAHRLRSSHKVVACYTASNGNCSNKEKDCSFPKCSRQRKRKRVPHQEIRHSQRLYRKNLKFPFDNLPRECKFKIFGFLDVFQRGIAALVSKDWAELMRDRSLWDEISFGQFPFPNDRKELLSSCDECVRYRNYTSRVEKYFRHLQRIRPIGQHLILRFDFAHQTEPFFKHIVTLIKKANLEKLHTATIDWTETPLRPKCMDKYCCLWNKIHSLFKHHFLRLGPFRTFLASLSLAAPNIIKLQLPFDWSDWSAMCLSRFVKLEVLILDNYFLLRAPTQELLDKILRKATRLKVLRVSLRMYTFQNRVLYSVNHPDLKELDLSSSQGFFLESLKVPSLEVIKVERHPWQGALLTPNALPCLYSILHDGAPNLKFINKHKLTTYWRNFVDLDLERLLDKVCPCAHHATGW